MSGTGVARAARAVCEPLQTSARRLRMLFQTQPEAGIEALRKLQEQKELNEYHVRSTVSVGPLDLAREVYWAEKDPPSQLILRYVQRMLEEGRRDEALKAMLQRPKGEELPVESWQMVFRATAKDADLESVNRLLEHMPERMREKDVVIHEALVECFARLGRIEELKLVVEHVRAENNNLSLPVYELVLHTLIKADQERHAVQLFENLCSGPNRTTISPVLISTVLPSLKKHAESSIIPILESQVDFYARSTSPMTIANIIDIAEKADIRPTEQMYKVLLASLCKGRLVAKAEKCITTMRDGGYFVDVEDYTKLLHACARTKQIEKAEEIFGNLLLDGPKPTQYTYNALLATYAHAGREDLACRMFKELRAITDDPGVMNYAIMIELSARREGAQAALRYFDEGWKIAGTKRKYKLLRAFFRSMTFCGKLDTARERVEKLAGWNNTEWQNILAICYAQNLEVTRALELVKECMARRIPVDDKVFQELVLGHAQNQNVDSMLEIFSASQQILGHLPVRVTNALIRGFAENGLLVKATEVFNMLGDRATLESYVCLIISNSRQGRTKAAEKLISSMEAKGMQVTVSCCTSLIVGYFKRSLVDKVEQLFQKMRTHGPVPDLYTYTAMIDGYGSVRDINRMEEVYKLMLSSTSELEVSVQPLTALICGYLKLKRTDKAERIFAHMKNHGPAPNVHTYGALISGYYHIGFRAEAEEIYADLKESDLSMNAHIIQNIFKWRMAQRNWRSCVQALEDMEALEIAPNIELRNNMRRILRMSEHIKVDGELTAKIKRILGTLSSSANEEMVAISAATQARSELPSRAPGKVLHTLP